MKTVTMLPLTAALLAAGLLSVALAQRPPTGTALPPPGLHDAGTPAVAPASTTPAPAATLPAMHNTATPRDARGAPPPEVRVVQRGEDTVQEYRRNGRVYMVVITPKSGIAQTYMVDPQGRLVDEHGQKPVRPVMYKVLEWGKSVPAAAASSGE